MSNVWPKVKLGELLRRSDEKTIPYPGVEYREITVRLWGKGVVERGRANGGTLSGNRFIARTGQFIASRIDARNGAMGIVPPELDGALVTNDFPLFSIEQTRLLPFFMNWLCRTRAFVELCQQASEGTTNRVRLKEDRFLALEIPLPPLSEQQRIVARIEELASDIAESRSLRKQAAEEVDALLHSLRRDNISNCKGQIVPLEEVCAAIIDNLHSNPRLSESGIPCIRSSDVGYGTLDLETAQRTDDEEYKRRTARGEPRTDDIVLVREGGGTGKCALVQKGQRFSLGQRVMMLRPNSAVIMPRFFLHQLLSPLIQEDQITPLSKGSASPHLNISALRKFRLILPLSSDQSRIVEKLDAIQFELNNLKGQQAETAAELDALLPAILDRAFKGDL